MADALAIARVRLRAAPDKAHAVRLRASHQLQAADLTPAGLPPAAILVVRRLSDPLPGRFGSDRLRPRADWERAVRGALSSAAQSAARPDARGRLDPSAAAVLFEDEAQLVACLIVDRAYGRAASAWWWSSLLSRLNLPHAAVFGASRDPSAIVIARPREAPAALASVARWGEASAVARAVSGEGAIAALRSIAREHGIPSQVISQQRGQPANRTGADRGDDVGRDALSLRAPSDPTSLLWERWIPSALQRCGVSIDTQRLFSVALCLHDSPAHLRSAASTSRPHLPPTPPRAIHASADHTGGDGPTVAAEHGIRGVRHSRARDPAIARSATKQEAPIAEPAATPASVSATGIASGAVTALHAPVDGMTTGHRESADARPDNHARAHRIETTAVEPAPVSSITTESVSDSGDAPPHARALKRRTPVAAKVITPEVPPAEPAPLASLLATEGVPTRLGGIFYLVHALDCLQLPDAFDGGWRLDTTVTPWGTLDLLARALLGASWPARDHVWNALGHLAGWSGDAARPYRSTVAESTSDPAWLAPRPWPGELRDPLDRLAWSAVGSRVWLWSSAGYVLAHRTTRAEPAASARRALRRFDASPGIGATLARRSSRQIPWMPPSALPAGCPARLGRWAAAAAPAVLRRLRLAINNDEWRVADLLRVPARLYVTSSHVDLVFALRDINLNVRRAGLDRNPGWNAAYGRVLSFHFE